MKTDILIAYASAGIGHKKAALAIEDALSSYRDVQVHTVDILGYTGRTFRFLYPRVYLFLINRVPFLWGVFYYLLDCRVIDRFFRPIRRFLHVMNGRRFISFIRDGKPDIVVCTHFMPADIVSECKIKGTIDARLITVLTDFMPHSFWLVRQSDWYIAAIEKTKEELVRRGIKEQKVKVMGIPCEEKFAVREDRLALAERIGVPGDVFTVFIMSGGFGAGPVEKIVRDFYKSDLRERLQFIVVCGKNRKLFERLNKFLNSHTMSAKVFGYVDNINEFMGVSDCIISKAGGLTVSESLARGLPMIIISPIPGQETRNCRILVRYGLAVRAHNTGDIKRYVAGFMDDPERIRNMRLRMSFLSTADSSREIAEFIHSQASARGARRET